MKAIILAAGRGVRMRPLSNSIPKCLIRINNISILERQIELLQRVASDIYVVVGHCAQRIRQYEYLKFKTLYNPFYYLSNDLVSLWIGRRFLEKEDYLVVHGNVLFSEEDLFEIACKSQVYTLIGNNSINFINDKGNNVKSREYCGIRPDKMVEKGFGGLVKIPKTDSERSFSIIERLFEKYGINISLTALLVRMNTKILEAKGKWINLVSFKDIEKANKIFGAK